VAKGCDVNADVSAVLGAFKAEGVEWVGRYYGVSKHVPLRHSEAAAVSAAGLWLVSIFESGWPTSVAYFTFQQGASDARDACREAQVTGQPIGTPIYATVDFDAPFEAGGPVDLYFEGWRSAMLALGGGDLPYMVGVYGSGDVCAALVARGLAHYGWLAQACGWSGSDTYTGWSIKQGPTVTVAGLAVDLDESNGAAGGWKVAP